MDQLLNTAAALVTIGAGLVGFSTYLRSRRNVTVTSIPIHSSSEETRLRVTVVNKGSSAVTLNAIGWAVVSAPSWWVKLMRLMWYPLFKSWINKEHINHARYDMLGEDVDDGPITVEILHGQQHIIDIDMEYVESTVSEDGMVAWPMAEDTLDQLWFADRAV